jgi:hypothetical protein
MRLQENVILVDGAIALLLVESKDTNDNQQEGTAELSTTKVSYIF